MDGERQDWTIFAERLSNVMNSKFPASTAWQAHKQEAVLSSRDAKMKASCTKQGAEPELQKPSKDKHPEVVIKNMAGVVIPDELAHSKHTFCVCEWNTHGDCSTNAIASTTAWSRSGPMSAATANSHGLVV